MRSAFLTMRKISRRYFSARKIVHIKFSVSLICFPAKAGKWEQIEWLSGKAEEKGMKREGRKG